MEVLNDFGGMSGLKRLFFTFFTKLFFSLQVSILFSAPL